VKHRILVVDDEAPIRALLSTYFQKRGYDVATAATAKEAEDLANGESIHLMILDIALADADGLSLLEHLKGDHPSLPIIILTGMGYDDELVREALDKKASAYVSKNLPLDQLLVEVRRVLNPK
jgi:DNA-binding response OmpR family regulator